MDGIEGGLAIVAMLVLGWVARGEHEKMMRAAKQTPLSNRAMKRKYREEREKAEAKAKENPN